ncbi:hypothetical protein SIN8267_02661 [Sinobacterium norvegicum]|uniref:HEAT repeat domain-containing protein n=1 Tax=Sinobacterium norvegicum TaxID=1641715 RepID=A0ABN8ELH0_9GAMM|nr:HEAT repeat domain-containing protein [Sinobacterium norvegicum]CAH0992528.1 hypothetical protein SIN8267_02661 [Sinobacterium norvegicum]
MIKFSQFENTIKSLGIVAAVGLMQGCSSTFTFNAEIDDPEPSKEQYVSSDQDTPATLKFSHHIPEGHVQAQGEILNYVYQQDKKTIDTADFFLQAMDKELQARNLPVAFDEAGTDNLDLLAYDTIAHRRNGFSPLVMISMAKVDLTASGETHRIVGLIKRAKVPIWHLSEESLVESTINQPQELLIKEVAAKINVIMFDDQLSDASVETVVEQVNANIDADADAAYQKVYELGYSNNATALPALRGYSQHEAEYIRLAAISGMGMIGGEAVLSELQQLYTSGKQWQDRAVALKAIGDIQSEESVAFMKEEQEKWQAETGLEATWNQKILSLYLD